VRPRQAALSRPALRARYRAPFDRSFYERPTTTVARALLGAWVMVPRGGSYAAARIVETEAYMARDPASHAFRGPTARNRSMFGKPGTWYVYRIHQVHCANIVTGRGQAVLLRAAEPLSEGLESLSGPGRLARAFGLSMAEDGSSAIDGRVRVAKGDSLPPRITRSPRVGISKAVERPLRYSWTGHLAVSSPRPWARRAA
jgi:DNA-3-methyladenine glycosylase